MDKKFWDTLGLILVVSNALGIFVLFEMLILGFPYISIFVIIFYFVWDVNKKLFKVKTKDILQTLNPKH